MSAVLFADWSCPAPYSARTVRESALGGTEGTTVRVAEALDARVMQHNRVEVEGRYLPPTRVDDIEHVVVLREPRPLKTMRERFPNARLYLWLHDLVRPGSKRGRRIARVAQMLSELGVEIVCVSNFQRRGVEATLRESGFPGIEVRTIYNPVDETLAPDETVIDRTKLVFFSSPNKGLAFTLDAFKALRGEVPQMRLCVGNPGYKTVRPEHIEGVDWLGALPHARILQEVRSALCVFYPNFVLPETFGLVLAEANAVGTPVLTHDCGAAAEVLADPRQVLPITHAQRQYQLLSRFVPTAFHELYAQWGARRSVFSPYIEQVQAWRNDSRPRVAPDARFRLSTIAAQWRAMFAGQPYSSDSSDSASGASSGASSGPSSDPSLGTTPASRAALRP